MFESETATPRQWVLELESEYRFEVEAGSSCAITLVKGRAEVFGAELVEGKPYVFGSECKAAIFTWLGCTIEMTLRKLHGSPVPEGEPEGSTEPPRVLILGPENSGKTTVCKILVNYAVRSGQGWAPMLVNVDPSEGGWAVPGALSAAAISGPIATCSTANPLGSAATSAPTTLASNALLPFAYWYGHDDTKKNSLLMDRLIRNLGMHIDDRLGNDPEGRTAGVIVDTPSSFASGPGATTEHRQKLIKACIDAFQINVILVVGHEKLNVEMQRAYGSRLTVVKIPKSGGVVELDRSYRERVHNYQVHNYFYGEVIAPPPGVKSATQGGETLTDLNLAPSSTAVNFSDLKIYRIGAETMAPSSALPIGAARVVSEMQPVAVDPSQPGSGLLNAILAILAPFHTDERERYDEEILDLNVIGFVVVTNLDIAHKKMTILSPTQGSLVGRTALIGSLEWQE
ncbi:Clp1-domain-containing protein [Dendrothele bispora CBS 962.96]|uniref:Polynucleotide 5'-hydroxyl-kinase GRC3 n=1 Tax=Dendrothele bispora (strain CBS 962.96) TaxID=1314807 RepID=A0A4S8L884_DENBC|nr:Clp1-domain-containing protein [Dendrothele bispora CBS 962.96]